MIDEEGSTLMWVDHFLWNGINTRRAHGIADGPLNGGTKCKEKFGDLILKERRSCELDSISRSCRVYLRLAVEK